MKINRTVPIIILVVSVIFLFPHIVLTASQEMDKSGSLKLKLQRTLKSAYVVNRLAWHPNNKEIAVGQSLNKKITVWNIETGQVIRVIDKEAGGVEELTYSPDGKYLAVGRNFTRLTSDHAHIHLYDAVTGKMIRSFVPPPTPKGNVNDVETMAFSPDSKYLVANGYGDRSIGVIYDIAMGKVIAKLSDGRGCSLHTVAFSPVGHWLAVGRCERTNSRINQWGRKEFSLVDQIQLWNTTSWKLEKQLTVGRTVGDVTFSSDGKYLALSSALREVNLDMRKPLQKGFLPDKYDTAILSIDPFKPIKYFTLYEKSHGRSLSYVPNKNFLIAGGTTAKLIDIETGIVTDLTKLKRGSLAFPQISPNGRYLAIGLGEEIELWKLIN
jgi:WD40 repeat protein